MKMTILPKLLYYFHILPLQVPLHFLRLLQNRTFQFIRANKHPRISRETLLTQRLQWVPNIAKYYLATQITQLSLLHATFNTPLWFFLELPNCAPIAMPTLLWLPHNLPPLTLSPLLHHSLQVWDPVWYSACLMSPFPPLLPIANNPLFPPGLDQPQAFSWRVANGFSHV